MVSSCGIIHNLSTVACRATCVDEIYSAVLRRGRKPSSSSCSKFTRFIRWDGVRRQTRDRRTKPIDLNCTSCIGCQSSSGSPTSWQFWVRTKFSARPLRFTVTWINDRITGRVCSRTLRSNAIPLLVQPFIRTGFSRRNFRFSAPSVWNSLPRTVLISSTLSACF